MKYPGGWKPIPYRQRCEERSALLSEVARRAVDVCRARPDVVKLLAFGSYARGRVSAWSDLDLLVVTEGAPEAAIRELYAAGMVGDVIGASADRTDERLRATPFGASILGDAVELYARPAS